MNKIERMHTLAFQPKNIADKNHQWLGCSIWINCFKGDAWHLLLHRYGLNSKPCFLPWLNIIKIREKLRKRVHSTVVNVTLKHTVSITINQFSCSDLLLWVHLHRCVLIQCQHKTQPNYCVKAPTLGRWLLPTPMSAACCVANVSQSGTALLLKLKPCIFFPSHRYI